MCELITTGAGERRLSALEFQQLASVPAAAEWCANIDNPRTRRAYQGHLADFCDFVGITGADEFRAVTRAHVLAWRAQLETRGLAGATIRRKLAALASLLITSCRKTPSPAATPCMGSNGPGFSRTKARRRHSVMTRLNCC
jgi:site-specific recombinase XerC